MIFLTANTMAIDDRTTTMDNAAINGNSGIVDVGEGDEDEDEDVGVGDEDGEEDELEVVASTVPPVTVAVMGSEIPPGA